MGICHETQKKIHTQTFKSESQISQNQKSDKTLINSTQLTQKEKTINRLSYKTNYSDISNNIKITDTFIGRGSSGLIREGIDLKGKKYAIKSIFKNNYIKNIYYKREVEITLNLNHENIIKCYDIYEDNYALNFVLELCEGGDLFEYILNNKNKLIEENDAMDILEQILKSLIYLHEEVGIVHRDIKPENILIKYINGKKIIKLTDFGFSDYIPKNNNNSLTEQLGTPQYAAPEIFEGKEYNSKVDIWSLGVVLYNMINGTQLFCYNDNIKNDVLYKKINFNNFKNPYLKNLAMKLLERNPEKRLNAYQALCHLKLIKNNDNSMTIPSSFNPDINKIINIDINKEYFLNTLKNIYIKSLSGENVVSLVENFKKKYGNYNNNDNYNQNINAMNININDLIEDSLLFNSNNDEFKNEIYKFKKKTDEKILKNKIVDLKKFFSFVIESKIFIQKLKIFDEFKKLDVKNRGYLIFKDCIPLFNNNDKNLPEIFECEKIDFGKFFNFYIESKHIYIPSLVICY